MPLFLKEGSSFYVQVSRIHPAHDRLANDTTGTVFCLSHPADDLWHGTRRSSRLDPQQKGPREYASLSHNRTQTKTAPESYLRRVLFFCGVILALMELYKQAFLYFIEFDGRYDWWYFPFQLCSIPMYLCLAVPFLRSRRALRRIATFLQDFGLLGGIMALAVPPGLMHPYWTMTLHGFIWHFILLFLWTLLVAWRKRQDMNRGIMWKFSRSFLLLRDRLHHQHRCRPERGRRYVLHIPIPSIITAGFPPDCVCVWDILGNLLYVFAMVLGGFFVHIIAAHFSQL